ncbi:hypothetical protein VMCG_00918 [Cytospora schulzeri]|uniref:BTB domain-containing protein n=1 Tax=Cytospora schulzeri TaxID=448051 RepID=A0A423X5W4_9PEZI|nr:hypothetical protein VMCG_00918 [Valsa malicola]
MVWKYELCLRRGEATRVVTRNIIRDRAGVWDDLVDQTLVHSPSDDWEFFEDGTQHPMPIVDIPAIDGRLEQEDDHALFYFIVNFLETGALDLGNHLGHVYGEPRASFYTLLQVHQVAHFLKVPELASAALEEMTRQAYRIHRKVEGMHDQSHDRNNRWGPYRRHHRPCTRPVADDRFADRVGSFVRCLAEIAQAMQVMPAMVVTGVGLSIDIPKDLGAMLVSAAYMLWGQLEVNYVFRNWWLTQEGRLFRGLILEYREPDWLFGTWGDWLAVEG